MKQLNKQKLALTLVIILGAIGLIFALVQKENTTTTSDNIKTFSSIKEISTFLNKSQTQGYYGGYRTFETTALKATAEGTPAPAVQDTSGLSSQTYSTTNIQVQSVDEADIVKNDGKYIYTVSQNVLSIINAYPATDMKIISKIEFKNSTPEEIFINNDKLIVFGRENYFYGGPMPLAEDTMQVRASQVQEVLSDVATSSSASAPSAKIASTSLMMPIYYNPKSFISIYDVSDRSSPKLEKTISYEGDYYDSRMVGEYVYAIVNQPIQYKDDQIVLPEITSDQTKVSIAPTEIYYFGYPDYSYRLTTVLAINLNSDDLSKKSFLTGYTQTIYVSQKNIYLTSQKQFSYNDYQEKLAKGVYLDIVDSSTAQKMQDVLSSDKTSYEKSQDIQGLFEDYYNKLPEDKKQETLNAFQKKTTEIEQEIQKETQKTIINKIKIDKEDIKYVQRSEVPGVLLNQFSMDENGNYFRVATTTGEVWQDTSLNHIYVLDENLNIVGKLEDLAPKEKIYSVRFMGDRAYMVTFKNIDPLFVIDLKDPQNPKVLGELKIPGYSNYLHPYDENHIIGVGKEAVDASDESRNFAYYQGIKIALFDVSDVSNPKEVSKFNIGDRGSDSEALYDHKAFLFDKDKNLLVLPVTVAQIKPEQYKGDVPQWAYGETVFQGAYVLNIDLQSGITYKGRIQHEEAKQQDNYYYFDYLSNIRRSLYIDNILYTISQKYVQANDLDTIKQVSKVDLPVSKEEYPPIIAY